MRKEFVRILKALDIDPEKEPEIESLRRTTLARCTNLSNAVDWNLELEFINQTAGYPPKLFATCALCKVITQSEIATFDSGYQFSTEIPLIAKAATAVELFRSCGNRHNEGISHWLLGVVHKQLNDDHRLAISEITKAMDRFKICGQMTIAESNYSCSICCKASIAMMRWSLALTYQAAEFEQLFLKESSEALKLVQLCLAQYEQQVKDHPKIRDDLKTKAIIEELVECEAEIQTSRIKAEESPTKSSIPPAASASEPETEIPQQEQPETSNTPDEEQRPILVFDPQRTHVRPAAVLTSDILDFAHASKVGIFVFDDEPVGEMTIENIKFDGKPHEIFSLRNEFQIKLAPQTHYRWLKVAGRSMNNASPVPLNPGDYVLAALNVNYDIGELVIADLINAPSMQERAGVIKRYGSKGLKSESTDDIEPIPLSEVVIRGVAIAVAKKSN